MRNKLKIKTKIALHHLPTCQGYLNDGFCFMRGLLNKCNQTNEGYRDKSLWKYSLNEHTVLLIN